jgi:hypothetical protein
MAIFALLQIVYLILIVIIILRLVTQHKINVIMTLVFASSVLLLSNEISMHFGLELFNAMFQAAYHFGAFLMVLTCFYLFIKIGQTETPLAYFILFCFLSIITIISDVVFAFYLMMPLTFTIIICYGLKCIPKKAFLNLFTLLITTTLCGYLLYRFLPIHYIHERHFIHYHAGNIAGFLLLMTNFYKNSPAIALLFFSFILFAPISLFSKENEKNWVNFVILFELVMIISTIPAFILTDKNLHSAITEGYTGLRHLQPFILSPIFLGLPLLIYKHTNLNTLFSKTAVSIALLILLFIASFNRPPLNFNNFLGYYPPAVACFDQYAEKLHLKAGVSNYWSHRIFNLYSHANVKIVSIGKNLKPIIFMDSSQPYRENQFDFVISKDPYFAFDPQVLFKRFGFPYTTFICAGGYEFQVYGQAKMKNMFIPYKL